GDGEQVEDADVDVRADDVDEPALDGQGVDAEEVEVGDLPEPAPGDDDESHQRRDDDDGGGEGEEEAVDVAGGVVLLEEELEAVGEGLAEAELAAQEPEAGQAEVEPDAVGADAVLDVGGDLALEVDAVGHADEDDVDHDEDDHDV